MTIEIEVQNASACASVPPPDQFREWAACVLRRRADAVLTIRIVDREESRRLNESFRGKQGPTNVLSFPADLPAEVDIALLGDVMICAPLVVEEAASQGKPETAHWAHLTIHGVLHLLGYDHQAEQEAGEMERLEISLLGSIGFPDPYQ
jgi:probable rRNA maturation factor